VRRNAFLVGHQSRKVTGSTAYQVPKQMRSSGPEEVIVKFETTGFVRVFPSSVHESGEAIEYSNPHDYPKSLSVPRNGHAHIIDGARQHHFPNSDSYCDLTKQPSDHPLSEFGAFRGILWSISTNIEFVSQALWVLLFMVCSKVKYSKCGLRVLNSNRT
jgi:hypothetical protein